MKKTLHRVVPIILTVALLLCCGFTSARGIERSVGTTYATIIMQGDTASASDCRIFKNRLLASGYGYTVFGLRGWTKDSNTPSAQIVTQAQFVGMKNYDVAYYSGHGGTTNRGPVINYLASGTNGNNKIYVAEALGVSTSSWQTNRVITPSDKLRVLVLATCSQLDSSVVMYYARIMRASGIRAIAGYHDVAPASGDDTIANNFLNSAKDGDSVLTSWTEANPGKNWAVLVYQENGNQNYRLPGFPGSTYTAPSASASIYRYASFLTTPMVTPVNASLDTANSIVDLPLTITTSNLQTRSSAEKTNREFALGATSVLDDDTAVKSYLTENYNVLNISDKICVQHYVSCEEVSENDGLLSDTQVVVERTYNYYDTYSGIKIVDSYIGASIDNMGIKSIKDERKSVTSFGTSLSAQNNIVANTAYISESTAIENVRNADSCCKNIEVTNVALAYVPAGNNTHQLCYEICSEHGFHYVNVQTGEIIS